MGNLTLIGLIAASCLVGVLVGWFTNNSLGTRTLRRSRTEAEEIIHQAKQDAEHRQTEARLAAREDRRRSRRRADREFRDKKSRLNRFQASLKTTEQELADRQLGLETSQGEVAAQNERATIREAELDNRQALVPEVRHPTDLPVEGRFRGRRHRQRSVLIRTLELDSEISRNRLLSRTAAPKSFCNSTVSKLETN